MRLEEVSETDVMIDKDQDPNLQAPQEANTTKHINFLEAEETGGDDTNDNSNVDSFSNSPTKKAWEELRQDEKNQQTSKE